MVVRAVPEAVEGQKLGLFGEDPARIAGQFGQDVDGQAAVARGQPPHFQAETNVAGLNDVGPTVVLHGVAIGHELGPGDVLHFVEARRDRGHVDLAGDLRVASLFHHDWQALPDGLDRPADGIAINGVVHAEFLILAVGAVDVAAFQVEGN